MRQSIRRGTIHNKRHAMQRVHGTITTFGMIWQLGRCLGRTWIAGGLVAEKTTVASRQWSFCKHACHHNNNQQFTKATGSAYEKIFLLSFFLAMVVDGDDDDTGGCCCCTAEESSLLAGNNGHSTNIVSTQRALQSITEQHLLLSTICGITAAIITKQLRRNVKPRRNSNKKFLLFMLKVCVM